MGNRRNVVVLSHIDYESKKIYCLGYGKFVGYRKVPDYVNNLLGKYCKRCNVKNPKIKLKSGGNVFGCECWFGDVHEMESTIKRLVKVGFSMEWITVEEMRKGEF